MKSAGSDPRAPIRHDEALSVDRTIKLNKSHVAGLNARGINEKEAFTIVDRDGRFFRAALKSLTRNDGTALVYEQMPSSTESPAQITLLCAVLARQRMMVVMQKATELGVARIVPVISEHSVQWDGLEHEKASAWPKQTLRAVRQCRRASLPDVRKPIALNDVLNDACFSKADLRVYLDDVAESDVLTPTEERPERKIALAVGPEGGWSDAERALLIEKGALPLRLGGRVLRAETAVLVGLTMLQHAYGDM